MEPERLARAPLAPLPLIAHPCPSALALRSAAVDHREQSDARRARAPLERAAAPGLRLHLLGGAAHAHARALRGGARAREAAQPPRGHQVLPGVPQHQTTAPDHRPRPQPHRCDWALTSAHGSAPGRHPKPNPNHRTPSPRPSPCPDQARCKACLNARAAYEKAAKGPLAERADFYEVDQSVGRLLCTLAKVAPLPVLVARAHRAPRPAPRLTPSHPRLCRSSSCRWRTSTRAASSWTRAHCTSRPSSGSSSRASRSTRTDTARRDHVEKEST